MSAITPACPPSKQPPEAASRNQESRVLELGTGTGAGTAWITHCLQGRDDVEVITVEIDAATAALAPQHRWPS